MSLFLGIVLLLVFVFQYTIVNLAHKVALKRFKVGSTEMIYYSSLIQLVLFFQTVRAKGSDMLGVPRALQLSLFIKVVSGYLSEFLLLVALSFTSKSEAIGLYYTNVLIIPVLSLAINQEKVAWWEMLGIAIGFVGVVMTVVPENSL